MDLTQGLHRAVQQQPDAIMTICGPRQRTFREVADRVARLAGALRGLGVGSGDRVGILALNSDRYSEYLLAVPWADAVLNPVNIRWSAAEIAYSLADCDTRTLFVDDAFAPMLPALRADVPGVTTVIHVGDGPTPDGALDYESLIAGAAPVADAHRGGDKLAGVFYTGGTTGFPKGVMLSHANLATSWLGSAATGCLPTADSRSLHCAPMFHLAALAVWGSTLLMGGSHVFVPSFKTVPVFEAIAAHGVTDVLVVPTMIQLMVDDPAIGDHDLTSLHAVLYGASPIPAAVLERAMKVLPDVTFTQAYGLTETAPIVTVLTPADHRRGLLRSAGRSAPHNELRIVDPLGAPVPAGTVGEIVVRGDHVMHGYWDKPAETAAAIRDGWFHTGDAGYLDEQGYLYVVDRIKDMIVSGGENVYSAEVENAIARHPSVAQCAVIGVPDADWGERVHAVVVPQAGASLTLAEVREHVKTLIAGYKAPRSLELVEALPISGAGKVLKRELRKEHWGAAVRQVH
ncbi:long-chain fatty acid--CoA ligase [Kribbella sandramycini]|uniref:Acyl-CoA synthetase (AMP-forming)/AMP-acid ligase II n=1 Tax=Kribbella sandramycini TaxID=60450 RepID=A0A7Y4KWS0_9ACTN|nr:long-chain fatty acid--CoA ligase [Kribbella sandramycini]MBB6567261.1 acyl-CoA synthetase (AMP-forming)/AMP-acid ligase II [Kribbella sandramycini]NOL40125.1 long-chain fatty acid--CoA ligase [Kribbella sandramycini]